MANFNCTTLLGYNLRKEYVGTMNYRNVITLQVETLYRTNTDPRYSLPAIDDYDYAKIYKGGTEPISLNGNGFGVGRVLSISEPRNINFDENGLTFWKRDVTIELYEAGDSSNIPNSADNTFYARLKDILFDPRISSISEDFNFSDDESGSLGYTHTVNITCTDEVAENSPSNNTKTGIYYARDLAQRLVESDVNFGFIGNLNDIYGENGKKTYSVDIDVINGSVSVVKTFRSFLIRTPANYSFAVESDGSISITENITLDNRNLAIKANDIGGINTIFDNIKTNSRSRCLVYFQAFDDQITQTSSVDSLPAESISLTSIVKSFDESNQQYTQSITYSNSRDLRTNYLLSIDQDISIDDAGFVTVSETGNFTYKKSKSKTGDTDYAFFSAVDVRTEINTQMTAAATRAQNLYQKFLKTGVTPSLKLVSSSRKASQSGKTFGYSSTFSSDSSLAKDGTFNKIESRLSSNLPSLIANQYIVPSYTKGGVFTQYLTQSSIGQMSVTQNGILTRNANNKSPDLVSRPDSAITNLYNNCLLIILNRLASFGGGSTDNFVVKAVSYSYNSNREVSVSVSIDYIVAANRSGPKNNLFLN